MGLFDTTTNAAVVTTLNLSRRQVLLVANNLANYDTPGYKSRALSFQSQLQSALGQGPSAVRAVTGQVVTAPGSLRPDGNNVSLTGQMTSLAEAQLLYQTSVQAFNTKVTELKIVTEGRAL